MEAASAELASIPVAGARRPRVAIFGDLYVRDNDIFNQQLLRAIEDAGAEAVTTPYADYVDICARPYFAHLRTVGRRAEAASLHALWIAGRALGARYRRIFDRFLDPEIRIPVTESEQFFRSFGLRMEQAGESWENLVKIQHLARTIPDLALFIQASPGFCCPSMVTEAMSRDIERATGVPVVSITYDGTGRSANDVIVPYVSSAADRRAPGLRERAI